MPSPVDKTENEEEETGSLSTITQNPPSDTQPCPTDIIIEKRRKYQDIVCYRDYVIKCLKDGIHQAEIVRKLWARGYTGCKSNAEYYIKSVREENGITGVKYLDLHQRKQTAGLTLNETRITEKELMERIWMGKGFTSEEREALNKSHPTLLKLECCVRKFKEIFETKNMAKLYLFIIEYTNSSMKRIAGFAKGLQKDIEAVENAVASEISNGFVEGTNNRVKMIRRMSFGRCGRVLLSAKLICRKLIHT